MFKRVGITGSPGTGKKTLAKGLSSITGYRVININSLCISRGAISGRDKYGIIANIPKLKKIVAKQIRDDNFLLVGHLLPYILSPKDTELAIVLRCNPYILEERLKTRGYPEKKTLMNIGAETLGTCYVDTVKKFGYKMIHVIDTSSKIHRETIEEALLVMEGKNKYDGSDIDWLGLVREKGDLRRLFPDTYY